MADEIIQELWKIKDDMANEHDCDVRALAIHLRDQKHPGDERTDLRSMKKMRGVLKGLDTTIEREGDCP